MNTIQAIRVLIVDDESLVRRVLKQILAQYPDIELVGEASTGDEAIAAVDNVQPDVVVMDIRMPKMDGVAAAREIKARHPEVKIMGLSEYAEGYHAHAMELAGAAGTYRKSAATEELYEIIKRVATKDLT
jgi:DNA-binding NarL/FixJ family response regulator